MSLDLAEIPLVDAHCHFFDVEPRDRDPARILSMSLENPRAEDLVHAPVYRAFIGELAGLLGVEAREQAVLDRRAELVAKDYQAYVRLLVRDIRLRGLVLDIGYRPAEVKPKAFEALVGARVRYLYRIEAVLDPFIAERGKDFTAFEDRFVEALEGARREWDLAGYKTIVAYRTGLDVGRPTRTQAREALRRGRAKVVRDYFVAKTMEICKSTGLPLQIHTGFGESNLWLQRSNPVLLKGLLDSPSAKGVRLVLVHGGYPYTFEAAYLAAMYPDVYVDFSQVVPFAPRRSREAIATLLDAAPGTKVMYGSDGYILPEIHWLGGRIGKRHLGQVLGDMVEEGQLAPEDALSTAHRILHGTAETLYRIEA